MTKLISLFLIKIILMIFFSTNSLLIWGSFLANLSISCWLVSLFAKITVFFWPLICTTIFICEGEMVGEFFIFGQLLSLIDFFLSLNSPK